MKTKPTKRTYEKPVMQVYLQHGRVQILSGSNMDTGAPTYNPFNDEQDW